MKCCGCNKEIDITKHELDNGEAQWYGKYVVETCVKVICNTCIKDPQKKKKYADVVER